jgi:hypothetical protein
MKVAVVPAQITTIEDRIAGNLGVSQVVLLAAPIFGGSGLYIVLPPTMHSAIYKFVLVAILACVCMTLAIRIKGRLVLFWLTILLRYRMRPRYYLYDKNTLASRRQSEQNTTFVNRELGNGTFLEKKQATTPLTTAEISRVQSIIKNPAAHLSFEFNRKGVLHALITETED